MQTPSCGMHVGSGSLTRDQTWAPCIGNEESYPLHHQGCPSLSYFIKLFIYGCVGSSFPCEGPPQPRQAGATRHRVARVSHHRGPSCRGAWLQAPGSRRAGPAIVAHGPNRSTACGIFPDQGSNPRPLHRQADTQPLRHQGSPKLF